MTTCTSKPNGTSATAGRCTSQLVTAFDPERDMNTVAGTLTDWPGFQRILFTEAHDYVGKLNDNRTRLPSTIHPDDPGKHLGPQALPSRRRHGHDHPRHPHDLPGPGNATRPRPSTTTSPLRWERTNTHAGIVRPTPT